jgi:hypothetical protein
VVGWPVGAATQTMMAPITSTMVAVVMMIITSRIAGHHDREAQRRDVV